MMGWLHDDTVEEVNERYAREQRSIVMQNARRQSEEPRVRTLLRTLKTKKAWHVFKRFPTGVSTAIVQMCIDNGYVETKIMKKKRVRDLETCIVGLRITTEGKKELAMLEPPQRSVNRLTPRGDPILLKK